MADHDAFIVEKLGAAWIMSGFSGHGFKFAALLAEAVADGIEAKRDAEEIAAWAAGTL